MDLRVLRILIHQILLFITIFLLFFITNIIYPSFFPHHQKTGLASHVFKTFNCIIINNFYVIIIITMLEFTMNLAMVRLLQCQIQK